MNKTKNEDKDTYDLLHRFLREPARFSTNEARNIVGNAIISLFPSLEEELNLSCTHEGLIILGNKIRVLLKKE